MTPAIEKCAAALKQGGVVAYPSEGVIGIGALAHCHQAVEKIIHIKGRAAEKGFILVAAHCHQLSAYIDISVLRPLLDRHWPAAVSFIVPARASFAPIITGGRNSIAVRITTHQSLAQLCISAGGALVSTSANISGQPSVRSVADLSPELSTQLDDILEGAVGGLSDATPIWNSLSNQWIR